MSQKRIAYKEYFEFNIKNLYTLGVIAIFISFIIDFITFASTINYSIYILYVFSLLSIYGFFILGIKNKLSIEKSYAAIVYITIINIIVLSAIFYYRGLDDLNFQLYRNIIDAPLLILSVALISGYRQTIVVGTIFAILVYFSFTITGNDNINEIHIYSSVLIIITTIVASFFVKSLESTMSKLKEQQEIIELQKLELQQINKEKDDLFSVIAHDLRGPIGLSKELLEYWSTEDLEEEDRNELMELLKNSNFSTYSLLTNLLTWATSNSERLINSPAHNSLLLTITNVIENLLPQAQKKGIIFKVNIDNDFKAFYDENMISTVLRNLSSNSIKFSNNGGIITFNAIYEGEVAIISVSDNGVGIETSKVEKLFKKKEIITTLGTDNEKGSGLGLKICENFVKLNKGEIWVESKRGKGTTFSFSLPLN